jgi:hypothetical protein
VFNGFMRFPSKFMRRFRDVLVRCGRLEE